MEKPSAPTVLAILGLITVVLGAWVAAWQSGAISFNTNVVEVSITNTSDNEITLYRGDEDVDPLALTEEQQNLITVLGVGSTLELEVEERGEVEPGHPQLPLTVWTQSEDEIVQVGTFIAPPGSWELKLTETNTGAVQAELIDTD